MPANLQPERLMVLAPHPDDEAIGAGGLIHRVVASGGKVSVVFITNGRENPWPQRYKYRRLFLRDAHRESWGNTRRSEAVESLVRLGPGPDAAVFLDYPDTRLAELARRGDLTLSNRLRELMKVHRPQLLVCPSAQDLHADHRATAYFAHHAMRGLGEGAPEILTYIVHGKADPSRPQCTIQLTDEELESKRNAIACHGTQMLLSRQRFLSYARATERFFGPEFDLVCLESRARQRVAALRHSYWVLLGNSRDQRRTRR